MYRWMCYLSFWQKHSLLTGVRKSSTFFRYSSNYGGLESDWVLERPPAVREKHRHAIGSEWVNMLYYDQMLYSSIHFSDDDHRLQRYSTAAIKSIKSMWSWFLKHLSAVVICPLRLAIFLLDVLGHQEACVDELPDVGDIVVLSDVDTKRRSQKEREGSPDQAHGHRLQ